MNEPLKFDTLAVHAGHRPDPATRSIAEPLYLSTTFERETDGGYPLGFSYSREGNPNRLALEHAAAALEGGKEALAFGSGSSVMTAVFQGLEPGDHILAARDVYYCFKKIPGEIFAKWPFDVSYVDITDLAAVRAAIRANTRLLWFESPSNPMIEIADLAGVAEAAKGSNAITICDCTFATPVLQRPLELGVDMVMHSGTKYIGGHSDCILGLLITRHDNYLFERARKSQMYGGLAPSPFDCWLAHRGLATMPLRVRAQSATALRLARMLEAHPRVERVLYPGLESCPGHGIAAKQMHGGFGGMLSFQVRGGKPEAMEVAARVKVFTRATSLGSVHSLIEHRASVEGPQTLTPPNLLRCSIGLEDPADLEADLLFALG
jgi:cystathionine gamma-synthase